MIKKMSCTETSSLLLLMMCSCLQLSVMSMECKPCSCEPDPEYGGILADCSRLGLTNVFLPKPGNITTLLFDRNDLVTMSVSDFQGMANLRHLNLIRSSVKTIERATEEVFTKLEYLDLSQNYDLGVNGVVNIASWLRHGTLKTLVLNYITTLKSAFFPLDSLYCSFLQHTGLKELHLDGNAFSYVGKACFSLLPKTIEVISARYTMIGDFDGANFTGMALLKSIRILDLTGFVTWNPRNLFSKTWDTTPLGPFLYIMSSLEVFRYGKTVQKRDIGKLFLYPERNELSTVDLSENRFTSLMGPISGFGNVKSIDFSQNIISLISKTLVTGSNRVKFVNLSYNDLGQSLSTDVNGEILKQFSKLEILDISKNSIISLPKQICHWSVNLRYVNISGNFLTNFDVDISHMSNLRVLNLKNNKLTTLPRRAREQLDILPSAKVIIDNNPLSCSCDTLEFLQWIRDSDHLQERDNLMCTLTNGTNIKLQFLDHILSSLYESCKSDLVLIASSVSGAFAVLMFVTGIMVYRHRWKLRYLYHAGRNRYLLKHIDEEDPDRYQYDAFISYADRDRTFVIERMRVELEGNLGLKLCIHDRDFLPGDIITDNIIHAIQNSRKTVILLSPEFLKSEWCIYEFHMARLDGITRKLNNLLVILLQEVAVNQLPKDLALMMTRNSYLEYSTDVYGEAVFWNTLTEGIKTLKRME